MTERIQAYPDRKVEVKFRIGEKTEGTGGGQNFAPPPVDIPRTRYVPDTSFRLPVRVRILISQYSRIINWTDLTHHNSWGANV